MYTNEETSFDQHLLLGLFRDDSYVIFIISNFFSVGRQYTFMTLSWCIAYLLSTC